MAIGGALGKLVRKSHRYPNPKKQKMSYESQKRARKALKDEKKIAKDTAKAAAATAGGIGAANYGLKKYEDKQKSKKMRGTINRAKNGKKSKRVKF